MINENETFEILWDDYTTKFNLLSDMMSKYEINIKYLIDVITAYNTFQSLSNREL